MGLRDILEAATPGEWDFSSDALVAVNPQGPDMVLIAGCESWEDARLVALAPELAALVLDMGEALTHPSIPPGFYREHSRALLARLDQLGKEPPDG